MSLVLLQYVHFEFFTDVPIHGTGTKNAIHSHHVLFYLQVVFVVVVTYAPVQIQSEPEVVTMTS